MTHGLKLTLVLLTAMSAQARSAEPNADRQQALVHMVRQDCGSCHGLTLKGGLGPALTPTALHQWPAESLAATIIHGRPGTPMPPFKGILDDADAQWIARQLLAGFPEGH
ncbi:MAG TPA: cytochrome c [Rhodocyclaceae bacterium]